MSVAFAFFEAPENCRECPCSQDNQHPHQYDFCKLATNGVEFRQIDIRGIDGVARPEWCPLYISHQLDLKKEQPDVDRYTMFKLLLNLIKAARKHENETVEIDGETLVVDREPYKPKDEKVAVVHGTPIDMTLNIEKTDISREWEMLMGRGGKSKYENS